MLLLFNSVSIEPATQLYTVSPVLQTGVYNHEPEKNWQPDVVYWIFLVELQDLL
jgi:hypothetical protein